MFEQRANICCSSHFLNDYLFFDNFTHVYNAFWWYSPPVTLSYILFSFLASLASTLSFAKSFYLGSLSLKKRCSIEPTILNLVTFNTASDSQEPELEYYILSQILQTNLLCKLRLGISTVSVSPYVQSGYTNVFSI